MLRRRPPSLVTAVLLAAALAGGCRAHTVAIQFDPEIGDGYRFRSEIETVQIRDIAGEVTEERSSAVLEATERVIAVDDDAVRLDVELERDGITRRRYEVLVDRGDRLSAIDLVEGVPAEALGLDVLNDLPRDLASPPPGPLEPGTRWEILRRLPDPGTGADSPAFGDAEDLVVTGDGHVRSLGVRDGRSVAVVEVRLRVPVRASVETPDGLVQLVGVQESSSVTVYDLDDGAARADRTEVRGDIDVVVEPPEGVIAAPVAGSIRYEITTDTERVPEPVP